MSQIAPTRPQRIMAILFGIAAAALAGFGVVEIQGVLDPALEDTFTELVVDLPAWAVVSVGGFSAVVGSIGIWSFGHYLEVRARRRRGSD